MKVKNVVFEDFVNYKEPSMFILMPTCSFKCDIENGTSFCQNRTLAAAPVIDVDKDNLCEAYFSNPITKAVVFGGLEPFDSEIDLMSFIDTFRRKYMCNDPIVIYTGYTEEELENGCFGRGARETQIRFYRVLKEYKNIIIKFGRFIPAQPYKYDSVLGVRLASTNQYAKVISYEN